MPCNFSTDSDETIQQFNLVQDLSLRNGHPAETCLGYQKGIISLQLRYVRVVIELAQIICKAVYLLLVFLFDQWSFLRVEVLSQRVEKSIEKVLVRHRREESSGEHVRNKAQRDIWDLTTTHFYSFDLRLHHWTNQCVVLTTGSYSSFIIFLDTLTKGKFFSLLDLSREEFRSSLAHSMGLKSLATLACLY